MHRGVSVQEKESSSSNEQGECEIIKEKKKRICAQIVEHVELILQAVLDFTRQMAGPSPFCAFKDRGQTRRGLKCVQDVIRLRVIDNRQ